MKTSFSDLKARNILSKPELQQVKGGLPGVQSSFGNQRSELGTCGVIVRYADGRTNKVCDASSSFIQAVLDDASKSGAVSYNWCCDSCRRTSYCG